MGVLKLTDWFPGDVKPVRVGAYNTQPDNIEAYQYWNGSFWGEYMPTPHSASAVSCHSSRHQNPNWRGLAHPPEEK